MQQANYSNDQLSRVIINSEFINMFEYLAQKAEKLL